VVSTQLALPRPAETIHDQYTDQSLDFGNEPRVDATMRQQGVGQFRLRGIQTDDDHGKAECRVPRRVLRPVQSSAIRAAELNGNQSNLWRSDQHGQQHLPYRSVRIEVYFLGCNGNSTGGKVLLSRPSFLFLTWFIPDLVYS